MCEPKGTNESVNESGCQSIPIIPLRYALMPKVLGNNKTTLYSDLAGLYKFEGLELKTAVYSVRTAREGLIYLWDGIDIHLWESDGTGNFLPLNWNGSSKGSLVQNISVSKDAKDVYIAYSQSLWEEDYIKTILNAKDKFMTKLDLNEILDGSKKDSTQENILPSANPEKWIEEYKTNFLEVDFNWSCSTPKSVQAINNLKIEISLVEIMRKKCLYLLYFMILLR